MERFSSEAESCEGSSCIKGFDLMRYYPLAAKEVKENTCESNKKKMRMAF
jgi:hypothetical protein